MQKANNPNIPEKLQPFYNFHGVQLLGSKFPLALLQQLHDKITNRLYDAGEYFKIFDNPDNQCYEVHATKPIKSQQHVFLIDHAVSFRYPQLRGLLAANPTTLSRLDNLTKYMGHNKQLSAAPTSANDPRNVEYDCMDLTNLKDLQIEPSAICLSLMENKLDNVGEVVELLGSLKELRALWLSGNPFEGSEQLNQFVLEKTLVQLWNRRLTAKATPWAFKFLTFKDIEKAFSVPNEDVHYLNLDGRGGLSVDPTLFNAFPQLRHISLLETEITSLQEVNRLIQILKLPTLRRLDVDHSVQQHIFKLFSSKGFDCSRKLLVNGHNVFMAEPTETDEVIDRVHSRVFKLASCYRLASTEKLDETAIWYVNDELGSSITHSDNPEVVLAPFLYSPNLKVGEELEAFTIMWTIKDIAEGQLVERDYLCGLPEAKQRSSRLAAWYDLPKQIYAEHYEKFEQRMVTLAQAATAKLATMSHEGEATPTKPAEYEKKVWKVLTDSSLLTQNLTGEHFTFTKSLQQADIVWLDSAVSQEETAARKKGTYLNQFPYEACLVIKNNLANTVQSTLGTTKFLQRTYDLETQLPIFLGHFYHNEEKRLDNLWISKPPNMARSMDMLVSDNLSILVRNMETGPKLVQKYISNPVKRLNRKIDLRFILLLQSVVPLQAYLYRHFWIRTSNNEYNLDCRFREEYETHFTVMNYGKKLTQIMHPQFVEQFDKDYAPIKWETVHEKIRQLLRMTLLAAQLKHPQMHSDYSRAVYGVDIMIDEDDFEPKLLEFTFAPDCIRACKFYPTFYNEIFEAFFLGKLSENIDKLF